MRLVLAQLWPHLVLDGSDCIDFGIIIFDDCHQCISVIITWRLLRARGFKCGYIDTGNPDHDIDHGIPPRTATSTKVAAPTALGYLDIGTRAATSPEHSSASSPVQASAPRHRPRRLSAFWIYFGLSPV
jgi:hypothetical protein